MVETKTEAYRQSIYAEVTTRVIKELEEGRLPWVQPWDSAHCGCAMPHNAASKRIYSGINVLILWAAGIDKGYRSQAWLTYRQALAAGGNVRRGETGTIVCYADHFTPKDEEQRAREEGREAQQRAFLRRFTVFHVDQCEGLTDALIQPAMPLAQREMIARADALIAATGAEFRVGGPQAFYSPRGDFISVPHRQAFHDRINFYRTALHELGHWSGHRSRLDRDQTGIYGSADYAREELVAEMGCAFTCASLSIHPTVRHSDYIGAWLAVLREDERAIFRAASQASKAADYLLSHTPAEEWPS
ncbi:zincin-like metallopeptidase domain-containing protein [Sphingomonas sp. BIUV-7]|uniref:Zincin-like metallopeptidase domain-containing protein n=1 Tax=Sphingomonas natans TaxID=3063330 RepID=A0ABT8YCN0_9SPHN|nr:zincin-like metallopeptidase domain-containing protein [Sphingomonas sp. BIUV-7]MDO6416092.1 zincin-like metallopeptidase domain-containing protein [Sphingomonas sp. BIUV-7]